MRIQTELALGPPGWEYHPEFLSLEEEAELVREIERLPLAPVHMHGVDSLRRVAHFGWHYGYESWDLQPAPEPPESLQAVRCRAARLIGVAPAALAETLVTAYPDGAGIGWHRDAPMFGPAVIGVSLLGSCVMRFRPARHGGPSHYRVHLAPRSAYVLAGEARARWQHCISPVRGLRYSISFRTLKRPAG
ncbi:MAG TPA: alpha-ketoglutarate-dependent dioxygenase AlkB [Polyangia bacterium]|jgi:alkylated DNA repair dioxygenase AlkB|nr:alpha-ketoglutarate-dependent dioxygenase AlkB [Polyangia bacterium]